MLYFWIAAIVVLLILEGLTSQIVTVWFEIGAVAGLIACTSGLPLVWQCVVFVIISALALADTGKFTKKFIKREFSPTNADRCIGETALVVEEIDNIFERGAVKINGIVWTARSVDGLPIEKDRSVRVERIDGVKLIVRK